MGKYRGFACSDDRTNLKMVGVHTSGAKRQKKIGRAPPLFGYARRTIYALVVMVSAFVVVSTLMASFLFAVLLLMVTRAQPFVKVGALCPHAL